jgi:hypothetical protein
MKYKHLNDDEIQQYVLEKANCDDEVMEHILLCTNCNERATQYSQLFQGIKQQEKPVFDFNLAELVIEQLPKSQYNPSYRKSFSFFTIFISILSVGVIGYLFGRTLFNLFSTITPVVTGLIVTTVTSLLVFLFIDMNRKYQSKMKALNFF